MKTPIAIAIENSGKTQEQVASALGVSRQAVQRWAAGHSPTLANLRKLAEVLDVSVASLSGEEVVVINSNGQKIDGDYDLQNLVLIPVLDVYASCGGGGSGELTSGGLQLVGVTPSTTLEWPGVTSTNKLHIIHITGDSMEPTLKRGADVIVDKNQSVITDDGIFVLYAEGQYFIKRVQRNLDGSITLLSDNTLYQPMHVSKELLEHVTIIGRVLVQMYLGTV